MARPDLYEILGVPRDATLAAIKTAFRRKAKDKHPDLGGDPEHFHLLKLAYDVLSDPEQRRHYDETGETPADKATNAAEEARFRTLVGEVMVALIAQAGAPEFTDILEKARESVVTQIEAVDHQLATFSTLAKRISEVLRRLHSPDQDNFLNELLQERLTELESKMVMMRAVRVRLVRLQERLRHYSYDVQVESIL